VGLWSPWPANLPSFCTMRAACRCAYEPTAESSETRARDVSKANPLEIDPWHQRRQGSETPPDNPLTRRNGGPTASRVYAD
jgi:hypothetical protein